MNSVAWSKLPNTAKIAKDFIDGRTPVVDLLGGDIRSKDVLMNAVERRLKTFNNNQLATAIEDSYTTLKIPNAVKRNIEKLRNGNTIAVVTGQQLGLFGGPLYTYYKALAVCELAKQLEKDLKVNVVPIFWMETADSDFSEINRISFPRENVEKRSIYYLPKELVSGLALGYHRFQPEIKEAFETLISWMNPANNPIPIANKLKNIFVPNKLMVDAFRELYSYLLGDLGLIMFDPLTAPTVEYGRGFWGKVLNDLGSINSHYEETADEISNLNLPLQVRLRTDALPFHYIDESGMRKRVYCEENHYKIGPEGDWLEAKGLEEIFDSGKGKFAPAALLRPVYQDYLLPTIAYVAGPAEMSYHAQIGKSYKVFGIERPLIYPRLTATLIEINVKRWMGHHNWDLLDIFSGKMAMLRSDGSTQKFNELFNRGAEHLDGWISRIRKELLDTGIKAEEDVKQAGSKLHYQWEKLHEAVLNKIAVSDRVRTDRADRIIHRIIPDNIMQERAFSPLYFIAEYGDDFRKLLLESLEQGTWQHWVIELGEKKRYDV